MVKNMSVIFLYFLCICLVNLWNWVVALVSNISFLPIVHVSSIMNLCMSDLMGILECYDLANNRKLNLCPLLSSNYCIRVSQVVSLHPQLLLVTSTFPPSPGPYPGIPSVPAPEPAPALAPAKDADENPIASPKTEDADPTPDIMSESNDVPVQADSREEPTVSVAADEEMADVEAAESKEQTMEVDAPQPSETIAAGDVLKESTEEVSTSKEEQQPVDEASTVAAPPPEMSAPMEEESESKPDVTASST